MDARRFGIALIAFSAVAGCAGDPGPVSFTDVAVAAGIGFDHVNGATGEYFLVETMGAGGAFLDYDADGDLDIYLVNGFDLEGIRADPVNLSHRRESQYWVQRAADLPSRRSADPGDYAVALPPAAAGPVATNALYRNNGDGTFAEVTEQAGVGEGGYGMGCAVADYDNDGDRDLYVTNFGRNTLYRSEGTGAVIDVTEAAGVQAPQWSTSAAFFDYDNDGLLDLYVVNYLDFSVATNKVCGGVVDTDSRGLRAIDEGTRSYCAPDEYGGVPDLLYRNQGNGTFADVSVAAGIAGPAGKGLGVVAWDYDRDGDQDVFVANDGVANHMFRNEGDGRFVNVALEVGLAYNLRGEAEAGMGVDLGDYDADGDLDLFVTNFSRESNTLYRNEGGRFQDVTATTGLVEPSWNALGFGTGFFDYDSDGDLDLFVANGHVLDRIALFQPGIEYEQAPQLFRNDGRGHYADLSASSGAFFGRRQLGRGAAFGDYDGDGDVDVLVTHCGGAAALLRNDSSDRSWSMVELVGTSGNRDAVGAEVRLFHGDRMQLRQVRSGSSYLSAGDHRLHFGLGRSDRVERIEVTWPGGERQAFEALPTNAILRIEEGGEVSVR